MLLLPLHFQVLFATAAVLDSGTQWFFFLFFVLTSMYTHPFPFCPVIHYSYIFNELPVEVKISLKFIAQMQKLQKKCWKKRKCSELLKGWKTQHTHTHTHQGLLLPLYLWGESEMQFHVASMLKYSHILKAQQHPCFPSVNGSILVNPWWNTLFKLHMSVIQLHSNSELEEPLL